MNTAITLNGTSPFKRSVAYRHSGLRPGIQYKNALFAKWCFLDSGSKPGMTVCHRLIKRGGVNHGADCRYSLNI